MQLEIIYKYINASDNFLTTRNNDFIVAVAWSFMDNNCTKLR